MRTRTLLLLATALCVTQAFAQSTPAAHTSDANHTAHQKAQTKEELLKYMRETSDNFAKSISGLSEAQLKFKAAPDKWSVMEVSEHIARSEEFFDGMVADLMKTPAVDRNAEMAGKEQQVKEMITDRSHKAQAPEVLKPTGKWPTEAAILKAFNAAREENMAFVVKTSETDLHSHVQKGPVGELDAQEWMLFTAAHTARHTKQIEEVKADSNFPKS